MLFNSIGFIFAFMPVVLAVYYAAAMSPWPALRRLVLIAATLVFYALGGPQFIGLLLASVAFNFCGGVIVKRLAGRPIIQGWALTLAIVGNIALLAYFKYFNFLLGIVNDIAGSGLRIEAIALPLGISFFTFQQIAYLVDVSRGRAEAGRPLDYAGFVLFFPQLLAGPIVFYRETAPQLAAAVRRSDIGRSILIGLAIFAIGLFKKTVIADTLALYAAPIFEAGRGGEPLGFVDSWIGALCYTAQVYFDFSGYSDMAIGTARMFGIILPLNFHSPLRSASVVEIWRRWHVTLGRWVQSYVFQPLSLPLARFAAERGYGRDSTLALAVILPTMLAMLIVGIWHGSGWPFVIFGLMQGVFMSVNESWAHFRRKVRKARKGVHPAWHRPVAVAATLLAFTASIVPFGSPTMAAVMHMFGAMAGTDGTLVEQSGWPLGIAGAMSATAICYAAIFILPNTQQIMGRFEPVLDWAQNWSRTGVGPVMVRWRMSAGWAVLTGLVFFMGTAFIMRGTARFIYFDF